MLHNVAAVAPRRLDNLPAEILEMIIRRCHRETEINRWDLSLEHHPNNSEWPLLKTLRSVNRTLASLITPRLFETIVLYQHEGYWSHLNNIATNPTLAPHVKNIKVAHIGLFRAHDFDSWNRITSAMRGERMGSVHANPPAGGRCAKYDYSLEACWERFQRWRDAESIMRDHKTAASAPAVALDRLTNLQSIQTVGYETLGTIRCEPCMNDDICYESNAPASVDPRSGHRIQPPGAASRRAS